MSRYQSLLKKCRSTPCHSIKMTTSQINYLKVYLDKFIDSFETSKATISTTKLQKDFIFNLDLFSSDITLLNNFDNVDI